ncbi:Arylsulfatase [Thalassoglobus polymorphus]|uniref:Arylsulfatase n=2 Tax=Thalassoglobus polymorphus TaxID=2527994 RepID=A0A517QJ10_9PLAN|nr:Arylsulfatase [Thalassoglobus polymorphus]
MKMKSKMTLRILTLAFLASLLSMFSVARAEQPNVLLIYTDDQGSLDANCYGSKDLTTPTQDHLAATGIRFTQMYSPSAICSASRAGLLTGRFPARAGVPGNVSSAHGHAGMPASEVTIAEMMKSAGYRTGHVGKWHLGYNDQTMPNAQGFDSSFGHMGGCIDNYSHFFYWNGPNRHDLWRNGTEIWEDGKFFPDLMVDECKKFISEKSESPFFLYWAINVPHYPMQGTEKWREHYKHLESPRRMYAEFVSTMDEKVGEVLDFLKENQLRENTIVIFQSDHGHSTEERAFFGGGNSGPYRGAKGCLFEGGLRVPSFISWPGKLPQGEVREQMVMGCDWYPTIADLCGIEQPQHHLDGHSIKFVLLKNEKSPHEELFWQLGAGKKPQLAIRSGNWKLLINPQDRSKKGELGPQDRVFLCNLDHDPGEMKNVASDHPEIVQKLTARIEAIRKDWQ